MQTASNSADQIRTQGYTIIKDVLPPDFVAKAKKELMASIEQESRYHGGTNYKDYAMVLLCSLYGGAMIDLFNHPKLLEPFNAVMGDGCIVYAYTSSSMPPSGGNYSNRIHVDCPRIIPGYVTNMGATILLDDFTEENGATWFLPHSQERTEVPSDEEFYGKGKRVIAPAGSVFFFNARLWHAGGANKTKNWRHALTINMCRPWMKQRIDIPRAMAHMNLSGVSETALQKLGFLAQVPANYDEYYAPPEKRKYRQKTE
jgi:ectoine hydroxylase-related dioxygenase (phytanoyl-CoA dioxygenase family)